MNNKIVIFGQSGFIGRYLSSIFEQNGKEYIAINTVDIDLTKSSSIPLISDLINDNDKIVFLSSISPTRIGKSEKLYTENVLMIANLCSAIESKLIDQLIYVSSEAVYDYNSGYINEESKLRRNNYYALMHLTRELILRDIFNDRLTILRPTQIYGIGDQHFAYGPNRFIRDIMEKKSVTLFNGGLDVRDHLSINNMIEVILTSLENRIIGVFNVATGKSSSFLEIVEIIKDTISNNDVKIINEKIEQPITERHFNVEKLKNNFPCFNPINLRDGIMSYCEELMIRERNEK